jgi:hypothetical protein
MALCLQVHPDSLQQLLPCSAAAAQGDAKVAPLADSGSGTATLFLQLASGSDCVLHTRTSAHVAPGCIEVDEVQQANLRLCAGEVYQFRCGGRCVLCSVCL